MSVIVRERLMFLQGIAIFVHSLAKAVVVAGFDFDVGYRTEAVADAPRSLLK
jgi:hypothetical protein